MIQEVIYDSQDIEKFLEITKLSEETNDTQTFKKLLSVQNKIPIISNIEEEYLRTIVHNLKFIQYDFKDVIIEEGDISQEIFFIISGECHVFLKKKKIGVLHSGSTFGESAAIFSTKRNASVICSDKKTTVLSFAIKHENMEFCAPALLTLYKNLALQINTKLEEMNENLMKK